VCAAAGLLLGVVACTEASAGSATRQAAGVTSSAPADVALQALVAEEARRARGEWAASRVSVVVLDPKSGRVLAASDDAPGRAVVPASTLKPLVVALALDSGAITAEQRFDCGNGERVYASGQLRDAGRYGVLDAAEILAVSSNIGMSRIFDALGGARLGRGLERLGLGARSAPADGSLQGAVLAIGQREIATSPRTLATAYAAIANDGLLVSPGSAAVRVLESATARRVRLMLEQAVAGARATGKAARVAGVRVAGKTGTSDAADEVHASFVGIVPASEPRFVIYAGVTSRKPETSGATAAAPLFARVAARALAR
jgi:cell division protein FtsI (penicillin-binding protein 3)